VEEELQILLGNAAYRVDGCRGAGVPREREGGREGGRERVSE